MGSKANAVEESEKIPLPLGPLIAGWLLPGAGHLYLRRWGRGAILMVAVSAMFFAGLGMQGRFFHFSPASIVDTLGFLGNLCSGLLYLGTKWWGYDAPVSASPVADYGTKFLLVAGLLNVLCVLDAYDIAVGKKN
jgi:hypothetical protein